MTSVCAPAVAQLVLKTALRAVNELRWRLTVLTYVPSMLILAWPRVGPTGPYQITRDPLKVKVALAPAAVAYLAASPA